MSQASASEKPAPAAGPLTAAITGKGIRRRSTIAWCSASAPRRTSEGRSISSDCDALLEPVLTSPPAQKALPAPVTISARSGARSASQAKATVISRIISGLIALKASGRFEGQGADLAVDLELERLQLRRAEGLGAHFVRSLRLCVRVWPSGQEPTL